MTTYQDLELPCDPEIVALCETSPPISGCSFGNQLVKISESLVAKFGIGVTKQEAENQNYASRNVNTTILYIPRVFRFFQATCLGFRMGFIVMEYVRGVSLESIDVHANPHLAKLTIDAIRHLATIPAPSSQGPGPVGGGPARGYLWSDEGTRYGFTSIKDMEDWMNTRFSIVKMPHISFAQHQKISMRHMDLVRRNIYLLPDSTICFLDWAFAGFYPDIFEIYTFRELRGTDDTWFTQLLELSPQPDASDEQVLQYLGVPAGVELKFA